MAGHRSSREPTNLRQRGWTAVGPLISSRRCIEITDACLGRLESLGEDLRVGDKPHSGTRRLVDVDQRVSEAADIIQHADLVTTVAEMLGAEPELEDATFRCPQPGFGGQQLHADDVARIDDGPPSGVTSIVALVDFTEENGATRLVPGSHRRPDLQRESGRLPDHPEAVTLTGPAGTGFVFSKHVLHSGTMNRSPYPRPALQLLWRPTNSPANP